MVIQNEVVVHRCPFRFHNFPSVACPPPNTPTSARNLTVQYKQNQQQNKCPINTTTTTTTTTTTSTSHSGLCVQYSLYYHQQWWGLRFSFSNATSKPLYSSFVRWSLLARIPVPFELPWAFPIRSRFQNHPKVQNWSSVIGQVFSESMMTSAQTKYSLNRSLILLLLLLFVLCKRQTIEIFTDGALCYPSDACVCVCVCVRVCVS